MELVHKLRTGRVERQLHEELREQQAHPAQQTEQTPSGAAASTSASAPAPTATATAGRSAAARRQSGQGAARSAVPADSRERDFRSAFQLGWPSTSCQLLLILLTVYM